jgi:hypothetical protein
MRRFVFSNAHFSRLGELEKNISYKSAEFHTEFITQNHKQKNHGKNYPINY